MIFKKKKTEIKNKNKITHLILNGVDISKSVSSFKLTQEGGERPKLIITCHPQNLDMLLSEVKDMKVKVYK